MFSATCSASKDAKPTFMAVLVEEERWTVVAERARFISFAIWAGGRSVVRSSWVFGFFVLGRAGFFISLGLGGVRVMGTGRLGVVL